MSATAATFNRINALVDKAANEIQHVLIQMPGNQIGASASAFNKGPRFVRKKAKAASVPQKIVCNAPDEIRVSPTRKPRSAASSSGSQFSSLLEKHNGRMGEARLYRSVDKKHLLMVHTVDLAEPMGDEEAKNMERALQTHSESSIKDRSIKKKKAMKIGGSGCPGCDE